MCIRDRDEVLGELKLDKDYDTFEGEIQWCGKNMSLSLEVNAESKPSWTRARSAAKKLLAGCETWDKAMRELAAKNLTELANNWLSQDEEDPRDPETDPITEEERARRDVYKRQIQPSWSTVPSRDTRSQPPSWCWSWVTALTMRMKKQHLNRMRQIPWN